MSSLSGPFGQCTPAGEVAGLLAPAVKRFVTFWGGGDSSWLLAAGYRFVSCWEEPPSPSLLLQLPVSEAGLATSLGRVVLRRVRWGFCWGPRLREEGSRRWHSGTVPEQLGRGMGLACGCLRGDHIVGGCGQHSCVSSRACRCSVIWGRILEAISVHACVCVRMHSYS